MINFSKLRKDIQDYDSERELLIKQSRDVLKLSKQIIYAVHRDELTEAAKLIKQIKEGKLVDLAIDTEHFILGLADLPGELVRKAVFLAGKGEVEKVIKIKDEVDTIYGELLKFDFRDNEVRRKFDSIKYDLRKLEDLVLDLKLKGR